MIRRSPKRNQWVQFICDEERVARYLTSPGKSSFTFSPAMPVSNVADFLQRLTAKERDTASLVDAFDLMDASYARIIEALPRLVRQLSHTSTSVRKTVGPGIKGKALWPQTIVGRLTGKIPPDKWRVAQPSAMFSRPENQLVLEVVQELSRSLSRLRLRIGSKKLPPTLSAYLRILDRAQRSEQLRSVQSSSISQKHVSAANRQRNRLYRKIAEVYLRRRQIKDELQTRRWSLIGDLLRSGWFEPINDDDMFEIYCLAILLDSIEVGCGLSAAVVYGLNFYKRPYIARFSSYSKQITITVYFQQTPVVALESKSLYLEILRSYETIRGSARRPDLMVKIEGAHGNSCLLLECKNSSNRKTIVEGLYQVLGYLHDFHIPTIEADSVFGCLLVATDVRLRHGVDHHSSVAILSGDDRASIVNLIEREIRRLRCYPLAII